jgi:hypothetical protein
MEGLDGAQLGLSDTVERERSALIAAVAAEREASLAELERYSDEVIADAWSEIRALIRIAFLGLIALFVVAFGVPFYLGMLVGRVAKRPS